MTMGRTVGNFFRNKAASARARLVARWFPPASGARRRARLVDTFDEWTIFYSLAEDESGASPELVDLVSRAGIRAAAIDHSDIAARGLDPVSCKDVMTFPGEHYNLLPALAMEWGARNVVEVGTFLGTSALALLSAANVEKVVTFDVAPWNSFPNTMLRAEDFGPRLQQHLGDLSDASVFEAHRQLLADADMVFIDAPKDGIFEYRFIPALLALAPRRQRLIVLDDVRVLPMINLWRALPLAKLDAVTFGHVSGTGVVIQNEAIEWQPPTSKLRPSIPPLRFPRRTH